MSAFLISTSIKAGLLLAVTGLLAVLLRRRSASLRHLVWAMGLGATLLIGLFGAALPAWRVAHYRASEASPTLRAILNDASGSGPAVAQPHAAASSAAPAVAATSWDWGRALVVVWAIGVALLLVRLGAGLFATWSLVRRARPQGDLLLSPEVKGPVTIGLFRPVIVVPPSFLALPAAQQEAILEHERAHARRRDGLTQLLGQLACALHWWNPLAWVAARRLLVEREMAADDAVLAHGFRPSDYAGWLLDVARGGTAWRGPVGVSIHGRSKLGDRIRSLLDLARPRRGVGKRLLVLAMCATVALTVPLACMSGSSQPQVTLSAAGQVQGHIDFAIPHGMDPQVFASVMRARLDRLDLPGASLQVAGNDLDLLLPAMPVEQVHTLERYLGRRGQLSFVPVMADPPGVPASLPEGVHRATKVWEVGGVEHQAHDLVGSRAALEPLARRLSGADVRWVLAPDDGPDWRALAVRPGDGVVVQEITGSQVVTGSNGPEVSVAFTGADQAAFQALTASHVGERVTIIFDDQVLWGAPVVMTPILGGKVSISTTSDAFEARVLAAVLGGGQLPAALSVSSAVAASADPRVRSLDEVRAAAGGSFDRLASCVAPALAEHPELAGQAFEVTLHVDASGKVVTTTVSGPATPLEQPPDSRFVACIAQLGWHFAASPEPVPARFVLTFD